MAAVARDHDLTESAVGRWVDRAKAAVLPTAALTATEREELATLRKQVKRLEMEREILKKAAAFFAKEQS